MDGKKPARQEHSAGGVVYRRRGRGAQVVLIATEGKTGIRWGLPKGHVHRDESAEDAARREVREETGLEAEIERRLPPIEYWFYWKRGGANARHHKRVEFFLMRSVGGNLEAHDSEVLEACWIPLNEAADRITFESERDVLRAAETLLGSGASRRGRRRKEKGL